MTKKRTRSVFRVLCTERIGCEEQGTEIEHNNIEVHVCGILEHIENTNLSGDFLGLFASIAIAENSHRQVSPYVLGMRRGWK